MTLAQFADRLGVTRQLVSRAIKAGRVPCVVVGPNGRPEIPDEKFELAKSQIEKSARPCAHAKIGAIVKAKAQNAPVAKVPKGPTAKLAKEGATELMDLESIAMIEDPYKRSVTLNQYWASRIKKQESLVRDGELVEAVKAEALLVDLGSVKNLARVSVNGHDLGVVWKAPFRVEAPAQYLHEGDNTLEVKVINLWPNRLIGDLQPGAKRRWTYESSHFYTKDSPLLPSGLLGPVMLSRIQK